MEEFPILTNFLINRIFKRNTSNQNTQNTTSNHIRNSGKLNSGQKMWPIIISSLSCAKNHKLYKCKQFLDMSPSERASKIKGKRLCIKCFKNFHGRNCKASNYKIYIATITRCCIGMIQIIKQLLIRVKINGRRTSSCLSLPLFWTKIRRQH